MSTFPSHVSPRGDPPNDSQVIYLHASSSPRDKRAQALQALKPQKKRGKGSSRRQQVFQVLGDLCDAKARGVTLDQLVECLNQDGLLIQKGTLRKYIGDAKRTVEQFINNHEPSLSNQLSEGKSVSSIVAYIFDKTDVLINEAMLQNFLKSRSLHVTSHHSSNQSAHTAPFAERLKNSRSDNDAASFYP